MPLVAHCDLPTFMDLRHRGEAVLTPAQADAQDIRELHIGLLNLMPDAALIPTERQFLSLLGNANSIVQIHAHPFTLPGVERSDDTQAYIDTYYESIDDLKRDGLDALIITGANIGPGPLQSQGFWDPLIEVISWAYDHVTSTLCSCMSSHALVNHLYGIERERLASKRWGVFAHRAVQRSHPLLRGMNTKFDMPHSRWNTLTRPSLERAGVQVLVESFSNDVAVATSPDGLRIVFLQGHPEYDTNSLLKEFKRDLTLWAQGVPAGLPPFPEHYLSPEAKTILGEYMDAVINARRNGEPIPIFPESQITETLHNSWADSARSLFANWIGLVYQLTNVERGVPWMDGVDPDNPFAQFILP
ncbi:homoserine O-succinyltransferase MetA [Stomatohabitans albus]|uniref:homoserine O-succinyltransferase MetA n=1 Tax=Stomatohabitans albus TaxID=3110766 RepID=UPI00300BFAB7